MSIAKTATQVSIFQSHSRSSLKTRSSSDLFMFWEAKQIYLPETNIKMQI